MALVLGQIFVTLLDHQQTRILWLICNFVMTDVLEQKLNEIQWSGRLLLFLPAVVEIISTVIVSTVTFAVVVVVVTIWPAIIRSISSVIVTVHADPWVPGNVGASSSSATTASRHVHLWNRDHQTWRQGETWRHRQNMTSLTRHDLTNLRSLIYRFMHTTQNLELRSSSIQQVYLSLGLCEQDRLITFSSNVETQPPNVTVVFMVWQVSSQHFITTIQVRSAVTYTWQKSMYGEGGDKTYFDSD